MPLQVLDDFLAASRALDHAAGVARAAAVEAGVPYLDVMSARQRLEMHVLVDLQLRGTCLLDQRDAYWTAKLCPREGVSQYHVPDPPVGPAAMFALGSYDEAATWTRATQPPLRY